MAVPPWFLEHLGWKKASAKASPRCIKYFGAAVGPNLADLSGTSSTRIAGVMYEQLGIPKNRLTTLDLGALETAKDKRDDKSDEQATAKVAAAGSRLEIALEEDIRSGLEAADPERGWILTRQGGAERFAQYEHLQRLQELFETNDTLKSTVGRDYHVSTDVMVGVPNHWSHGPEYSLHAAVSSKLTIRSDRVQNIRFEFGTLVRNRRGRLPHLVVVTAEPLPSRLLSIARGTGEIDAVYHLLYEEMDLATKALRQQDRHLQRQAEDWDELVATNRVRPYSELHQILALS